MSSGPLAGCGVLVTRPAHLTEELVAGIEAVGGVAIRFPAIDIVGRPVQEIADELERLPEPDILVFVSRNAVVHGLPAARGRSARIAAVGPATKDAIEAQGIDVDIFPDAGFDSEHLLRHAGLSDVHGSHIIILRGQSGRELLAERLRERGAHVHYLRVYERKPHKPSPAELEHVASALEAGSIRFLIVMSVDSLQCLLRILPPTALASLTDVTLVAPSARVLQTASELIPGIETALASGPQAPEIVDTLMRLVQSGKDS